MAFERGTCVDGVASCEVEAWDASESAAVLEDSAEGVVASDGGPWVDDGSDWSVDSEGFGVSSTASRVAVSASICEDCLEEGRPALEGAPAGFAGVSVLVDALVVADSSAAFWAGAVAEVADGADCADRVDCLCSADMAEASAAASAAEA